MLGKATKTQTAFLDGLMTVWLTTMLLLRKRSESKNLLHPIIRQVITVLEAGGEANPNLIPSSLELKLMLKEWKRLEMRDGLLYRTHQSGDDIT